MAFSWTNTSALGKSISPMTFGAPVTSMITKLSLVTERRLMVSAGEGRAGPREGSPAGGGEPGSPGAPPKTGGGRTPPLRVWAIGDTHAADVCRVARLFRL